MVLEANESPLEMVCHLAYSHGSGHSFQVRDEGCFLRDGKERTSRHFREPREFDSPKSIGIAGKVLWQLCGLASLP